MFKSIFEATSYIENRRVRHTFEYFKDVLDTNNIPYQKLKCIHVTGTNGKGGTINFIASILRKAGYKVATFTSPYIICHQDRFTINGKMMSEEDFIGLVNENYDIIEKYNLSMFEADTLMMFQYFDRNDVDVALIEVGIGGRNDKTNMVTPMASIITNVGKDHLNQIGPTLKDVAYEKAGIIKEGVPVYTSRMDDELLSLIENEANLKHSSLHIVDIDDTISLSMKGAYHLKNASMAKCVISDLFPNISEDIIEKGLYEAVWPGRFEYFKINQSDVYLDGAHNLHALKALLESVEVLDHPHFIYAALRDKDYQEMACHIQEKYTLSVCQFEDDRALSKKQSGELNATHFFAYIDEAVHFISNHPNTYVVCGSLHFISQFRNKII